MMSLPVPDRCHLARLLIVALLAVPLTANAELECYVAHRSSFDDSHKHLSALHESWAVERVQLLTQAEPSIAEAAQEKRQRERLRQMLVEHRTPNGDPEAITRLAVLQQSINILFSSPFLSEGYTDQMPQDPPAWLEEELAAFLRNLSRPAVKKKSPTPDDPSMADSLQCVLLQDRGLGLALMALPGLDPLAIPVPVERTNGRVVYRVPSDGMQAADGLYRLALRYGHAINVALPTPYLATSYNLHAGNFVDYGRLFPLELRTSMPAYAVTGGKLAAGTIVRAHTGDHCSGWVEVAFTTPLTQPLLGLLVAGSPTQPTLAQLRHVSRLYAPLIDPWKKKASDHYRNLSATTSIDIDDDGVADLRFASRKLESRAPAEDGRLGTWASHEGFAATLTLLEDGREPGQRNGQDSGPRFGTNVFMDCAE